MNISGIRCYSLRQLFWECTLRCNMTCLHCGSECKKSTLFKDMPLCDFVKVLDEIHRHQPGVPTLVFTLGGEPLVRPDIMECGREITRRGFLWGMVSNGYLIDKSVMNDLSANGLRSLSIDIDGLPDEHDWLRNRQGAFDKVYNSIAYICEAKNLTWDVITCVNPRNILSLPEIKKMLIDAGVKAWRVFTIIPMGRAADNPNLSLSNEEFMNLMEFVKETRKEGLIDMSYSCEGYLGKYELKVRDYQFFCQSGINTASIFADGNISGCLSVRSKYHQGNIYKDSFWDTWTYRFQPFRNREWMKIGGCADCEVWKYCHGNGFHLRRDDGSLMLCHYNKLQNKYK